jgi:DegV family protein with EDD domain
MAESNVAVVVDSSATIPLDLVNKYNLHVIPQIIIWEGETYLDGVDITVEEFYTRLGEAKELPSTSQPSVGEFHDFFRELTEKYASIVGIFVSQDLSGTIASATAAAKLLPDFPIEIIDSRSVSMALGFIAIAAAKAAEQGSSHEEVASAARRAIPKAKAIFVVDTLEYLHRGGRIGGARRLLGSMLSMKPLLHIDDGQIDLVASIRTKRKALERAIELIHEDTSGKRQVYASVVHSAALDEARAFKTQIAEMIGPAELTLTELSPAVGTNVGPGVIGLAYFAED